MRRFCALGAVIALGATALLGASPARAACPADTDLHDLQTASEALSASPPAIDTATTAIDDIRDSGDGVAVRVILADLQDIPPNVGDAQTRIATLTDYLRTPSGAGCANDAGGGKSALNDVYSSPVFAGLGKPPQENIFTTIGRAITDFFSKIFSALGSKGSAALLLLILALVLFFTIRKFRSSSAGRRIKVVDAEPEVLGTDPAEEWLAANDAASRGDYREAIRRAFRSALLAVAERGRLFVDPSWTNRELLARAHADGDLVVLLAPAATMFERAWYSGETTTLADWETARARCSAIRDLAQQQVPVR